MTSSQSKGGLIWLLAAAVFLTVVLWFKREEIFGAGGASNGDAEKSAKPGVAPPKWKPAELKLGESPDPNAPEIELSVVDDETGKPIGGARVVMMTRQGTVLSSDLTGENGTVVTRPTRTSVHGAAAWHADYQIGSVVSQEKEIEVRLKPLSHLQVDFESETNAEWRTTSVTRLIFKFDRTINPFKAGSDYLAFRLHEHLGLRDREWNIQGTSARIPKYLTASSQILLRDEQRLPNHLDQSGMRSPNLAEDLSGKTTQTDPKKLPASMAAVSLDPMPKSPHRLILHYPRKPDQKGIVMLHLGYVEKDVTSPNRGSLLYFKTDYSTFEERDGRATFKVYELHKNTFHPTLLFFEKGNKKTLECNPIRVDGRVEATLTAYAPGKLTVTVSGAEVRPSKTEPRRESVWLFEDDFVIAEHPADEKPGRTFEYGNIPPGRYQIFARGEDRVSPIVTVDLAPGQHKKLELPTSPVCKVTLVLRRDNLCEAVTIRNVETGTERTLLRELWSLQLHGDDSDPEVIKFRSMQHHRLDLPFGSYVVQAKRGNSVSETTVVLDAATKDVSVK